MIAIRSIIVSCLTLGAGLLWLAPQSQGTIVVNVDFNAIEAGNPTTNYTGQGALVTADAHFWNGFTVGTASGSAGDTRAPLTSSALLASDGITPTAMTVSLTNPYNVYDYGGFINTAPSTNALLFEMVYNASSAANSFRINNLSPNGLYDLYLYGAGGLSGGPDAFAINGITNVATRGSSTLWTLNKDYVFFSRVAANGSGQITGSYAIPTSPGVIGVFTGLQIAESVPEPSSLLLFGVGSMLVWRCCQRSINR